MKVEVTTDVTAPPEVVFATLTDLTGLPAFLPGVRSVEVLDPGPLRVGTRFRETRMMYGREATEEMTFAHFDPPRRFVLTAENHGARYVTTHEIAAAGSGSRIMLTFEGTPVTLLARLMSFMFVLLAGNIRKMLAADLRAVKVEAERRADL